MPQQAFHRAFLEFSNHRYLKLAALVVTGSILAYARDSSDRTHFGGTRVGYALGALGAALILWLLWFGVRKRRYASRLGTVQGWLSAHVYLGLALLVVATLHTGFEGGWNVHTLAYVLMLTVIASGAYGTYAYVRFPALMAEVMGDDTLETLFLKLPGLDLEARRLALSLPDEINRAVLVASQRSRVGGGVVAQLRGVDPRCPTAAALELVRTKGPVLQGEDARRNHELYAVLLRKQRLLERARLAVMLKARLDVWLYAHVPLSFALLAALGAHVLSVFLYRA